MWLGCLFTFLIEFDLWVLAGFVGFRFVLLGYNYVGFPISVHGVYCVFRWIVGFDGYGVDSFWICIDLSVACWCNGD